MSRKTIETSLTLDYRMLAWGIERIVLDAVSNHLPADSGGTYAKVLLKQNGRYVDLLQADPSRKTTEVVIEDNGQGYSWKMFSVLFSSKETGDSVGQFGEGLKMISAAALRNGIDVRFQSRDWTAKPFPKEETIDQYELQRLCYHVKISGDPMEASRTIFRHPSDELMAEIYKIPQKMLQFNHTYQELHMGNAAFGGFIFLPNTVLAWPKKVYPSRIIDLGGNEHALFIKGVRVHAMQSLFSYDLGLSNITPDRVFADNDAVLDSVASLLKGCTNDTVIRKLLEEAKRNPEGNWEEFRAFARAYAPNGMGSYKTRSNRRLEECDESTFGDRFVKIESKKSFTKELFTKYLLNPESLYLRVFRQLWGDNAVIASNDTNENKDAELLGYTPVRMHHAVANYLAECGAQNAKNLIGESVYKWVPTGKLSAEEQAALARLPDIDRVLLGSPTGIELKVYEGVFTKTGRAITSNPAVYENNNGQQQIGFRQDVLTDFYGLAKEYIHELGHAMTGKGDYEREFVDWFVRAMSKLTLYCMDNGIKLPAVALP